MVRAGIRFVRARTAGAEIGRVAAFLLSGR
jgi:hypothetical protein